jgi:hypothetical protein
MRQFIIFLSICLYSTCTPISADSPAVQKERSTSSFTGKITKDRVRMRLQPNLDSYIFKELSKGDLVLVTNEVDDFYACMPPKNVKAYIFRTYVLDGAVEGSNVNVRLEPDITSPVVAQLSSGYKIHGETAQKNNKWLEIAIPDDVRFYVAKEFIVKAGDASLYQKHLDQEKQLQSSLVTITQAVNKELEKPFGQIQLGKYAVELQKIIDSSDFPTEAHNARELLTRMEKEYLIKGIASGKAEEAIIPFSKDKTQTVVVEVIKPKEAQAAAPETPVQELTSQENSSWNDKESFIIQDAITNGEVSSADEFYKQEIEHATTVQGIIKPYNSFIKNRPGDFILVHPKTNLPLAYLYSTKVDLSKCINKEVSMQVADRPNNHFAFPAYFVLSAKQQG